MILKIMIDEMKEAKTVTEFVSYCSLFTSWFGLVPEIKTVGDKIIASIPEEVDFEQFWLKPLQHEQFFIYLKNIDIKLPSTGTTIYEDISRKPRK